MQPKILPTDTLTESCENRVENGRCSGVETVPGLQEASSSLQIPNRTKPEVRVERKAIDDEEWVDMNQDGEFEILDEESSRSLPEDNEYVLL
jgi:hypothetical protein